jgi:anti-anti-sigma factor
VVLQTTVEQAQARVPVTIVALDGELDASSFEQVIDTVRQVHDAGARHLLLDLTKLTFISSSGLVALHSAFRLMRGEAPPDPEYGWNALHSIGDEQPGATSEATLRLCGTQSAVQKVLDRTGLGGLIPSHPDRASALAAF